PRVERRPNRTLTGSVVVLTDPASLSWTRPARAAPAPAYRRPAESPGPGGLVPARCPAASSGPRSAPAPVPAPAVPRVGGGGWRPDPAAMGPRRAAPLYPLPAAGAGCGWPAPGAPTPFRAGGGAGPEGGEGIGPAKPLVPAPPAPPVPPPPPPLPE